VETPPGRALLRHQGPVHDRLVLRPWTIVGEKRAYFVGWCPACGSGTVSLTVTLDGGRHFRRYALPKLNGFMGTGIHVAGDKVTITAKSQLRTDPRTRTVTIRVH